MLIPPIDVDPDQVPIPLLSKSAALRELRAAVSRGCAREGFGCWVLGAGCWVLGAGDNPGTNSCRAQGRARAHARHALIPKLAQKCSTPESPSRRHIRSASRFLNHHLVQRAHVGYELSRLSHHLVDGLIGRRNLVEERLGVPIFVAHHRLSKLLVSEGLASGTPRVGQGGHPARGQGEGR